MSLLGGALSCVILRLHLHRECSGEGEGNMLKYTPPAPQEAMCEMYSVFHQALSAAHELSLCAKSSVVLALK